MRAVKQVATGVVKVIFFLFLTAHMAFGNSNGSADDQKAFLPPGRPLVVERHDQNSGEKYWEKLNGADVPFTLVNWQLVADPRTSDKYMNRRVVGVVKNNSRKEFPEVKVEFIVYDENGNQIAIVLSNYYDFKPGDIWKFEIPVTSDVSRARFNGFSVPLKE